MDMGPQNYQFRPRIVYAFYGAAMTIKDIM